MEGSRQRDQCGELETVETRIDSEPSINIMNKSEPQVIIDNLFSTAADMKFYPLLAFGQIAYALNVGPNYQHPIEGQNPN